MLLASKLMMGDTSPKYVRQNLLRKVEEAVFGSALTINNMRTPGAGFTYCGTLPVLPDVGYLLDVWRWSMNVCWSKVAETGTYHIIWRNEASGLAITERNVNNQVTDFTVQPYIEITLLSPTGTMQTVTISVNRKPIVTATGSWAYSGTNEAAKNNVYLGFRTAGASIPLDLGLVYDRVLTPTELEQNYNAFVYRHRRV